MKIIEKHFLLPVTHGLFNNCHASTLVSTPQRLLAAFFAGEREGAGDTAIWLCRREQGSDNNWAMPERLIAEPNLAHWNPVLWALPDVSSHVILFYKVGANVHCWQTRYVQSFDAGLHWTEPQALVANDPLPRGPVKNKPIALSNGDWLAPASLENAQTWDAFVDISSDHGISWQKFDVPFAHSTAATAHSADTWSGLANNALWECDPSKVFAWDGVIQPTVWESFPGQVHMLLRSTRGFIYRSDSTDFGRTWCTAYPSDLPNNNSGIDLVQRVHNTHHKDLFLAYNPIAANWGQRTPLSLAYSRDNGLTWSRCIDLETSVGEFSYPAIIAEGDTLHVSYTFNRQNMVYQRVIIE